MVRILVLTLRELVNCWKILSKGVLSISHFKRITVSDVRNMVE